MKSFHPSCKELLSDLSKNCILIDHKNNLQLNHSEKKWLFNPYRTSAVINSAFRGTCADGVNKTTFNVTIGTRLGKKSSHQIKFPSSLSGSERKFFGLFWKIFNRFCRSAFIPPVHREPFWGKTSKIFVPLLAYLEVEQSFSACCRNFFRGCRTCILRLPKNMSGEDLLFWRSWIFISLSDKEWKFPGLLARCFCRDCQKCTPPVHRNTLRTKNEKKVYDFFPDSKLKKSGLSSNVLSKDRQNSNLPVQGEEGFFPVKGNFKPFSDIQPNVIGHLS